MTFQIGGKGQSIFQCEVDKLVRIDGQWTAVVRLVTKPVTRATCDILCVYITVLVDGILPDSIGELW